MFAMKRPVTALAAALALAGCKDSVSPSSVDTGVLTSSLSGMATTFQNNAAYQSMAVLADTFPSFGGTTLVRQMLPTLPQPLLLAARAARAVPRARSRVALAPSDIQALFPSNVLGKTFEWNTSTDAYEATTRTGAPATGIRIIIYTVNTGTGAPNEPLAELGYLELTDESTPAADILGVLLKLGTTTIADYTIAAASATNSMTLTAVGYITGSTGSGRVDFDLMAFNDYTTDGGDFEYTLTAQGGGEATYNFHDNGNGTGTSLIRVSQGGNTVEITTTDTQNGSSGQVKFNGTVVATMTQSGLNDPVWTNAAGHQLTAQQREDLTELFFGVIILMIVTVIGILAPALVVF